VVSIGDTVIEVPVPIEVVLPDTVQLYEAAVPITEIAAELPIQILGVVVLATTEGSGFIVTNTLSVVVHPFHVVVTI
jgi:hypothetical protein